MRQGINAKRRGMVGVWSSLILAVGLVAWTAGPAAATVFSNTAAITIPLLGAATPYPSPIAISGLNGTILDVNVTLTGITHTYPDDIDVLLVGPLGQNVVLMSGVGSGFDVTSVGLSFDDAAAASLPDSAQIVAGTFKPTAGVACSGTCGFSGGAPAPVGPYGTTLSVFNGTAPNGTWNLFVYDDSSGDSGSISGGWSLDIATNAPTITSFSPGSGAIGSAVAITGTNFTGATAVKFNGTSAVSFTVNSSTLITATVPVGASSGTITVTTPAATATSATSFVVTSATITSFTPASGRVGVGVVISGTNFTGATAVRFNGTPSASFTVDSPTQITATVTAGASTGPITVTTTAGTAASATSFVVKHARSASLTFSGPKAKGTINVTDGFSACRAGVPAKVQHFENGNWKTVGSTLTQSNGTYKVAGLTRSGKYRTVAKKTTLSSGDVCLKDISPVVKK